ncbi:MAG: DMT family transporter [Actinomycetota bacterium]
MKAGPSSTIPSHASRRCSETHPACRWGSSFLLIKVAVEAFSPLQIVFGRVLLGAAVLLVLVAASGLRLASEASTWKQLTVMGTVSNIIPFALITWGEQRITSGLAAILNSTTPLFTATIAAMFLPGETLKATRVAGIALGFVGVAVIVGVGAEGGEAVGQLAVVAASLSYGVGFVYARHRLTGRTLSPLELSAGQLVAASALALPLAALDTVVHEPAFTPIATIAVAALGMLGTGIAYTLYYRLVQDVGPTSASFVTYLLPIFGVALGRLVLDERLGWNTALGALLVIAGIVLAERAGRAPRAPVVVRRVG